MHQPNYEFEQFMDRKSHGEKAPILSIQNRGVATVNKAGVQALGEVATITLLFDKARMALAMKAGDPDSPQSYPLRRVAGGTSTAVLSLASFLRYYDLDSQAAQGRYQGIVRDDMIIFDLTQPINKKATTEPSQNAGFCHKSGPHL